MTVSKYADLVKIEMEDYKELSLHEIISTVRKSLPNSSLHLLQAKAKDQKTALTRQAIMYFFYRFTKKSTLQVAKCANKDHTCVIFAYKKLLKPGWQEKEWMIAIERELCEKMGMKQKPRASTEGMSFWEHDLTERMARDGWRN